MLQRVVEVPWQVEVYFDGECPLCRREIAWLRRQDRLGPLRFVDIAAEDFCEEELGFEHAHFMAEIQGRLPNGEWIRGVEVFRQIYVALGWGALVRATRWPGVSHGLDWAYRIFARNRLKWTGRCDSNCRVECER